MTKNIRILIVDDQKIVREGIRSLFEHTTGFQVIAEADRGIDAIELAKELKPEIVLMDISIPGIKAMKQIVESSPETKVLSLSINADKRLIKKMFDAGAVGYLGKDCTFTELLQAIDVVMQDKIFVSPTIAGSLIENITKRQFSRNDKSKHEELTGREIEILRLFAHGKTPKEIALVLDISIKTVSAHRRNLMKKLQLFSLSGMMIYAINAGLISPDE